jgi:ribosomal protein L37AE/L43A
VAGAGREFQEFAREVEARSERRRCARPIRDRRYSGGWSCRVCERIIPGGTPRPGDCPTGKPRPRHIGSRCLLFSGPARGTVRPCPANWGHEVARDAMAVPGYLALIAIPG